MYVQFKSRVQAVRTLELLIFWREQLFSNWVSGSINSLIPNSLFLYPLKTSENRKGVEKGCIGNEWVKNELYKKNSF